MIIDLEKIQRSAYEQLGQLIDAIDPWDFNVQIAETVCATNRPTVADVMQLENLRTLDNAALLRLVGKLFCGGASPEFVENLGPDLVAAFLAAYLAYFRAKLPKNFKAIADLARSAVATELARYSG